jgi:hypothetical protein
MMTTFADPFETLLIARFEKGQSGNPGGRPKVVGELREIAQAYTTEAIEMVAAIMADENAPPAARVAAQMLF